ncbi:5-hydroxytryptamine receptor 3A-like [Acanthopagrus latus]|uniref:5-hydroxytryptamine receptor 3A-like n=1 Tax=Acanthopagrus latus TaxID=8177 RepID=UPI00187C4510|nr:5-hydroxytryptamine receptor 3A-like [Acanthopagrus latus]
MMLAGFLFLLLLTDGESSNGNCTYRQLFMRLYPKGKGQNTMTRPVTNHTTPTEVRLDVLIYAILDLNEKDQKFVSYVWIDMALIHGFTLPVSVMCLLVKHHPKCCHCPKREAAAS